MKSLLAYLIDPVAKTVEPVDFNGTLDDIYKFVDARPVSMAYLREEDDGGVYVDDEGLLKGDRTDFFVVNGYPQPLAGKGLWVGPTDDEGEETACRFSHAQALDRVLFATPGGDGTWTLSRPVNRQTSGEAR
jgi:hypothetical protein